MKAGLRGNFHRVGGKRTMLKNLFGLYNTHKGSIDRVTTKTNVFH